MCLHLRERRHQSSRVFLPSVLAPGHAFPLIPVQMFPLLWGISYRLLILVLITTMMEYDEYIRSRMISAQLGRVLILYHYLSKSVIILLLNIPLICSFVVIRLLEPSLICSFHWAIVLLILYCIIHYCYLRPMVLSIQYWYSALVLDHCHHPTTSGSVFVDYGLLVMDTGFLKERNCDTQRT